MKTARTYVFRFVPIPTGWFFHEPMISGFGAGSNGSFPTDENNRGALRWPEHELEQCGASALPNHLFWTWFVDNPRRNPQ
jgi:hypothetical protein